MLQIYVDLILWLQHFFLPFFSPSLINRHHHHLHFNWQSMFTQRHKKKQSQLGCAPNLSQNMFFTGTTTIPLSDVMHQNHQSVAMTQNRTPPTLFQYPSKFLFLCMSVYGFLSIHRFVSLLTWDDKTIKTYSSHKQ